MKVEHITFLGDAQIRDTDMILPATRRVFDVIGWEYKSQSLHLPKLPFQIKITADEPGAMFNIEKNGNPAILNVCCFKKKHSAGLLRQIDQFTDMYKKIGMEADIIEPVTDQWLYSVVINPVGVEPHEAMTAGEVELYIYEQLYLAYNKKYK